MNGVESTHISVIGNQKEKFKMEDSSMVYLLLAGWHGTVDNDGDRPNATQSRIYAYIVQYTVESIPLLSFPAGD